MKNILAGFLMIVAVVACSRGENAANLSLKGLEFAGAASNGTEITIAFDANENRVSGKVANRYFGPFEMEGNTIRFGMMASTMMMGPREAMDAEREYLVFLNTVNAFEFDGKTLVLKGADGKTIEFKKVN